MQLRLLQIQTYMQIHLVHMHHLPQNISTLYPIGLSADEEAEYLSLVRLYRAKNERAWPYIISPQNLSVIQQSAPQDVGGP